MISVYRFFINIFFPLIVIFIFLRTIIKKEDRERYKEKLFSSYFNVKRNYKKKLIWFHAASIGELNSIVPLIEKINENNKFQILITTVTLSSSRLIKKNSYLKKNVTHRFFPIDKMSLVNKFLDTWLPSLIIFVDSEIWPNFILEIKKRDKPLVLLNSRITEKSFSKWILFPNISKRIFQSFSLFISSSRETSKYLKKLEVKNIKYFGNLKLSTQIKLRPFKENFFKKNKIWCALSTHEGEDILCLKSHLELKKIHKNIVTIIIPRHIQRSSNISLLCKNLKIKYQVVKAGQSINSNAEVLIVNSYGFTAKYLRLCKSVFIGKSLLKRLKKVGGQNPIEAAKLGCKIYHGPYTYNFQEIYDLFRKYKISEKVTNQKQLVKNLNIDFNDNRKKDTRNIKIINNLGKNILRKTHSELINII